MTAKGTTSADLNFAPDLIVAVSDLPKITGMTPRRIDYLIRTTRTLVVNEHGDLFAKPGETVGSGHHRFVLAQDADRMVLIRRLVDVGIVLRVAVHIAETFDPVDVLNVDLGEGIELSVRSLP